MTYQRPKFDWVKILPSTDYQSYPRASQFLVSFRRRLVNSYLDSEQSVGALVQAGAQSRPEVQARVDVDSDASPLGLGPVGVQYPLFAALVGLGAAQSRSEGQGQGDVDFDASPLEALGQVDVQCPLYAA